jgi:hypothetical protein
MLSPVVHKLFVSCGSAVEFFAPPDFIVGSNYFLPRGRKVFFVEVKIVLAF